jgi:hypothetical protein
MILYTPLDIEFTPPSYDVVDAWFEANKIYDPEFWVFKEGRHNWAIAALSHVPERWDRIAPYERWMAQEFKQSEGAKLNFAPGFEAALPGLAHAVRQMPFLEIGAVGLLKQKKEIEPHRDTWNPTKPMEPSRYMIYVTDPFDNTFYMEDVDGSKHLVTIHPEYRAFAFTNTLVKHGAFPPRANKILISVVGILDQPRHEELVNRSVAKFGDYVLKSDLAEDRR